MSLASETAGIAHQFYLQQQRTARRTANELQRRWNAMPKDNTFWDQWYLALPELTDVVTKGQYEAATRSAAYVKAISARQNIDVPDELNVTAFLSATDDLNDWLTAAPATSSALMKRGVFQQAANLSGLNVLVRQSATLTQDAGRTATGVYTAATPGLNGYYRKLSLPSCDRCAVLAGKWFKFNEGFERHPRCDCEHVPAGDRDSDMEFDSTDALKRGQITGLSEDDRKAILEDNADLNQVVNSKRGGMRTSESTLEGTTVRGVAGVRLAKIHGAERAGGKYRVAKTQRLTPTAIYKIAGNNKDEARKLLYRNGYIL